jgi:crotonobetainyl-CoA:carnitine CoA-transferase CaiB-like acyl-CoA transferase
MNYLLTGTAPRRSGNRHPNIQPQNVYACSEGHLALAVGNDSQFRSLCHVLGETGLADDPRFATNAGRVENLPSLESILERKFIEASASEWDKRLQSVGVPAGRINSIAESLNDPQIIHRAMIQDLPRADGDISPGVVSPMKFRNAPLVFDRAPPDLGADTAAVLSELGFGGGQ